MDPFGPMNFSDIFSPNAYLPEDNSFIKQFLLEATITIMSLRDVQTQCPIPYPMYEEEEIEQPINQFQNVQVNTVKYRGANISQIGGVNTQQDAMAQNEGFYAAKNWNNVTARKKSKIADSSNDKSDRMGPASKILKCQNKVSELALTPNSANYQPTSTNLPGPATSANIPPADKENVDTTNMIILKALLSAPLRSLKS